MSRLWKIFGSASVAPDSSEEPAPLGSSYPCDSNFGAAALTYSRANPFAVIRDGRVMLANPAFSALFDRDDDLSGVPITELFAEASIASLVERLRNPGALPARWSGQARHGDGTMFEIGLHLAVWALGDTPTIWAFAEDLSAEPPTEARLRCLAYTDALTGLPNRSQQLERIGKAAAAAREAGVSLAVIVADIIGLKRVNDTMGYQTGDVLLHLLAQRFKACIRDVDTLARVGGDRFCALLPRVAGREEAEAIATRLIVAARRPVTINGHPLSTGISAGIAMLPEHGDSAGTVLAAASDALELARRAGGNRAAWATAPGEPEAGPLPLIAWDDAAEIGVSELDTQHHHLTDCVNNFAAAVARGADPADVARELDEAIAYARYHFATEERLMEVYHDKTAAVHRAEHIRLVSELCRLAITRDAESLNQTAHFLREWLLPHINTHDRALAQVLARRAGR